MMKTGRKTYSDKLFIAANQNIDERDYWLAKLSGRLERTHFPYDFFPGKKGRPGKGPLDMDSVSFRFSDELFAATMKLSGGSDLKFHMILAAGLMVLLERYTGHEDIMIGSPILKQDMEMDFVNAILVFRNRVEKHMTFKQLLIEVRETIVQATKNQNYPMEVLVDKLNLPVTGSESPLFDVALLLENIHDKSYIDDIYRSMTFIFGRTESDVEGVIRYDSRLYRPGTIRRIANHFTRILEAVLADVDVPLGRIDMLSEEEKGQILTEFNQPLESKDLLEVQAQTLYQAFEKQVMASPDRIAVVRGDHQVTYCVLDEKANILAQILRQKGLRPDAVAALWVPPSIEMMVGQLGILKSGAAYLPIALDAPEQRVRFILEDSNVKILVSEWSEVSKVSEGIEVVKPGELSEGHPTHLTHPTHPTHLCYVIYTSGTTGQPKGVMVEHRQVMAYLHAFYREFDIKPWDAVIQLAPYSFDVFIEEVYSLLLRGGKVIIPTQEQVLEIRHLSALISRHQVSIIDCTPLLLSEFNKLNPDKLCSVRLFINGGDILKEEYITNLSEIGTLYNTYGPTETTVCASFYNYTQPLRSTIPIGKPIAGYHVYILDEFYCLRPIGVAGEICIAGAGVTRGYLNRPELTAEKFIEYRSYRSYSLYFSKKIYKTGDLARWLPDGNIEFLGRKDHQVKIRGYRIEAGEIEYQLFKRKEIKEAVVIPREDKEGEKYLCAYIVPIEAVEKSPFQLAAELREYLLHRVPDYMVPSFFIPLERIPLNPNGKIDRKALPEPEVKSGIEYIPPSSVVEKRLVQIWQDVFGLERIGVKDDFFDLGGHSLRGIQVANEIHKTFDVDIQFTEVFQRRTIEGLAEYIEEAEEVRFTAIEPVEKKEYYVLSSAQRRLYLLQRMIPESTAYNMPQAIPIGESVDRERLEQAFKQLIQRHESLRTSFEMINRELVQRIHETVSFKIEYFDSSDTIRPLAFDFSKPPLFRAGLLKEGGNYTLLLDMHHIVTDAVSMGILTAEFSAIYPGQSLPKLRLQYKDYAEWQNSDRQKAAVKKQEGYWLRQCAGELPVLDLPIDYPRPVMQSFEGSVTSFPLGQREVDGLKEIAVESGVTLYMMVLALYNLLLAKLSGQEDIIVGAVIAGRSHADIQDIMGMFVNTLAMRNYPCGEKRFVDFLEDVKQNTTAAYKNQDYPFEDLVENLLVKRDIGRNPVFDVVFNWMNREEYEFQQPYSLEVPAIDNAGEESSIHVQQPATSKFDLNLTPVEFGDGLFFAIEYCTKLFKPQTIERFTGYFEKIVNAVVENPHVRISEIEILGEEEKNQLLFGFNQAASEYPRDKTIHQLFEEQAEKRPDGVSVVGSWQGVASPIDKGAVGKGESTGEVVQLTYRELDKKSDQLAYMLIERGVLADDIIAIMMERSIEMIIGILGILKAGGAYLPIDPDYPRERSDFMLADSNAAILLAVPAAQVKVEVKDKEESIELIDISELPSSSTSTLSHVSSANMAYIIYTSGSTGKPKGVAVEHHSVVNLLFALFKAYPLYETDCYLLKTPFIFDVSVSELFGWFLGGGRLVVLGKDKHKEPQKILDAIEYSKITHINFVPSMFGVFIDQLVHQDIVKLSGLKYIFLAGEALPPQQVKEFRCLNTGIALENLYGPTEDTVYSSKYGLSAWDGSGNVPIGKPLPNTELYILDKYNHLQPIGVPGELCISGIGLARGYLNRPELAAEKFGRVVIRHSSLAISSFKSSKITNDHCPMTNGRLYRTGDLARWLPDGNIEFIGRMDDQVKIRGFRVEPGEIENQLRAVKGIKEAVVIARDDHTGQKYLCGYIVLAAEIDHQEVKNILSRTLPAYMIPTYFMELDKIPLTPNGKVDRRSLPVPEVEKSDIYAPPGNETEEKMVEIWSEILDIKKEVIGIHDNFFERGGQSLKVTMLAARIHEVFQVDVPIGEIFQNPTIKGICQLISVTGWVRKPEISDNLEEKEEIVL
ncbi:MAG: amino acid adenylation domain-containing protein [Candidatus Aminicenantes bacterium]|nr:amino acid adenylation domain-containing protein [Candidatus Aminicenantes bacterium]NIM82035.1 amino acid adenylation domain-containing protein [Candidatus Aminicenantes bacterium]NIN21419.1 amino acid adenylation domain-containing protein [Candidatus Aminicenantes bacterium]NIN45246.1 amino acid adenylation domain-containing protein [Candidatus Aminicenantes bacterium]NIN88066.1 amino acid adenylation domain-containing protein [Candidatus Aminicenantes bacterium]